jgi:transposase
MLTSDSSNNQASVNAVAATEVPAKPQRRVFTAEQKRRILSEIDHCQRGEAGVILRREGLYSSTIIRWRKELREALTPRKRGRKASEATALRKQNDRLQRDNERLRRQLQQAEKIMEIQKKVSEILNVMLPENDYEVEN